MPDRFVTTWAGVAKGDYVESVNGSVWKVTHEIGRDDGRWLGITNAADERRKIAPTLAGQQVTRLVYGDVTEEQAVKTVLETFPGSTVWTHPSIDTLLATDELRAHLVRFHDWTNDPDLRNGDLAVIHQNEHSDSPDIHVHEED